jgi:hypothetical protein
LDLVASSSLALAAFLALMICSGAMQEWEMKSAQWKLSTVFCVDRNKFFNYVASPWAGCQWESFPSRNPNLAAFAL